MRIIVFDVPASTAGALSILKDFFSYIGENDTKHEWYFVVSTDELKSSRPNVNILVEKYPKKSWIHRIIWEVFYANKIVKRVRPDVILSFQNTAVMFTSVPQVTYIHQSLPFYDKKWSLTDANERIIAIYSAIFGFIIRKSVTKAKKVIVQTKWMKETLIQKCSCEGNKISVISPSIKLEKREDGPETQVIKGNCFFYPCSPVIYKNIKVIVSAVKQLVKQGYNPVVHLTIRGNENDYARQVLEEASEVKENIKLIGEIPREKVMELYKTNILLFPSYVETYGLPLLEARISGTPIIAADRPFSREVLEGYERVGYFDPFSADELAEKMAGFMKEETINRPINSNNTEYEELVSLHSSEKTWGRVVKVIEETKSVR